MREKKEHESEKHREKIVEPEKDEKELEKKKKKKKNKVVDNGGRASKVVEALKTSCIDGEECMNVYANGWKDFDSLKEKKKKMKMYKEDNKKKEKEGVDGMSSLGENFEDDRLVELVKGQGHNKYCRENPVVDSKVEQAEKKKKKKKEGVDGISYLGGNVEDEKMNELVKERVNNKNGQDISAVNSEAECDENRKKKKKKKKDGADAISSVCENVEDDKMDDLVKEQGYNKNCQDIPVVNGRAEHDEKKKKKKKKDGLDAISCLGENVEDDKMNDLVKGQGYSKSSQDSPVVNSEIEEAGKKKKRKREKEDGANVEKNIVTDVKKLSKERNNSGGKINEGSKLAMKEKNRDKVLEDNEMGEVAKAQKGTESDDVAETNYGKEGDKSKKKKKKRKQENASGDMEDIIGDKTGTESTAIKDCENVEYEDNVGSTEDKLHEGCTDVVHANDAYEGKKKAQSAKLGKGDDCSKDKKKKAKVEKQVSDGKGHEGKLRTKKDSETNDSPENTTPQGKSKRVSFSDHVEVFSSSDGPSWSGKKQAKGLVQGKRFSPEEDEKVKEAVFRYIEERGLGDEGLDMILNCKQYPEVKNCWKYIAASIPWRPLDSVYYRAHILFERDENRKWTAEEYEFILKFYKEHGSDWKKLSKLLKKHRLHVKDTFRRIKCTSLNKGRWSQEEYQKLFDLVNKDLRIRASEEKKSKHGMLRDNICWGAISERLTSRHYAACCMKWYHQLTSSMVAEGLWVDTDDYHLLDALSDLDAACIEDVDWDSLLEHRDGNICRKRWNQMVKHIGGYGNKSFSEQVEILSNRYSLDVLEAREEYDSKEPVDLIANKSDDSAP
ncbi:Octamer-binding transcription factor [Parasponia andersonii]|uniref:Octamer-binding transcription factor n=1 Tax=Parasponia andersonii TaxID=3476 RepID=A0A2P5BJK9_PARAD|nr:Octamer-binding transcription factor [Parasponia andersonii]